MKLLLDQNLSRRIIPSICEVYPQSSQIQLLGMEDASDKAIWEYARTHDYAIVTLDADFQEYSLLRGRPPLIIWLKCRNQRKEVVLQKL
jgi:predicted nuclease of predicted toxin-antitoxin system